MAESLGDPLGWLAAVTALLALSIAYHQLRTARAKLRLDLYERRFRVFDSVSELLAVVLRDGDIGIDDLRRFTISTNEAAFLFGQEVTSYIEEVRTTAVRLRALNATLHESDLPVGPERTQAAEADARILQWFSDQFAESRIRFGKYLDFRRAF